MLKTIPTVGLIYKNKNITNKDSYWHCSFSELPCYCRWFTKNAMKNNIVTASISCGEKSVVANFHFSY
jgi:hypothetical protein